MLGPVLSAFLAWASCIPVACFGAPPAAPPSLLKARWSDESARQLQVHVGESVPANLTRDLTHYSLIIKELHCAVRDCSDLPPQSVSGVYTIQPPDGGGSFEVFCDFDTDPAQALTVFQRRKDGTQDFYLDWSNYKAGFGTLAENFWLGNDKLHRLTSWWDSDVSLRVDMCRKESAGADEECRYAAYSKFAVADEDDKYMLTVSGFSASDPSPGDSLSSHSGQRFTTKDQDNDVHNSVNCAVSYTGAWWYSGCHASNLNGKYGDDDYAKGVSWASWTGTWDEGQGHGHYNSLEYGQMALVRPRSTPNSCAYTANSVTVNVTAPEQAYPPSAPPSSSSATGNVVVKELSLQEAAGQPWRLTVEVSAASCNLDGCSAPTENTVKTTAPRSPATSFKIKVAGDNSLRISIGPSLDDGGANVTSYVVAIFRDIDLVRIPLFLGKVGKGGVFGSFEFAASRVTGTINYGDRPTFLERLPASTVLDPSKTRIEVCAMCSGFGSGSKVCIEFTPNENVLDFFKTGTNHGWQSLSEVSVTSGGAPVHLPTMIYTGESAAKLGWVVGSLDLKGTAGDPNQLEDGSHCQGGYCCPKGWIPYGDGSACSGVGGACYLYGNGGNANPDNANSQPCPSVVRKLHGVRNVFASASRFNGYSAQCNSAAITGNEFASLTVVTHSAGETLSNILIQHDATESTTSIVTGNIPHARSKPVRATAIACNAIGCATFLAAATTGIPLSAPSHFDLHVTDNNTARLRISPPLDDGGANITGYVLFSDSQTNGDCFFGCAKLPPQSVSGVYTIQPPDGGGSFEVFCDFDTDPAQALTVFQRRKDGTQDFYLDWSNYKAGFGTLAENFWLGNDKLHRLTSWWDSDVSLRVDMCRKESAGADEECRYAAYSKFAVADEDDKYMLTVSGFSASDPSPGDSLSSHSGQRFTTKDQDNDVHNSVNCAVSYTGAWWYSGCHASNLNGKYGDDDYAKGVSWASWTGTWDEGQGHGHYNSLEYAQMALTSPPQCGTAEIPISSADEYTSFSMALPAVGVESGQNFKVYARNAFGVSSHFASFTTSAPTRSPSGLRLRATGHDTLTMDVTELKLTESKIEDGGRRFSGLVSGGANVTHLRIIFSSVAINSTIAVTVPVIDILEATGHIILGVGEIQGIPWALTIPYHASVAACNVFGCSEKQLAVNVTAHSMSVVPHVDGPVEVLVAPKNQLRVRVTVPTNASDLLKNTTHAKVRIYHAYNTTRTKFMLDGTKDGDAFSNAFPGEEIFADASCAGQRPDSWAQAGAFSWSFDCVIPAPYAGSLAYIVAARACISANARGVTILRCGPFANIATSKLVSEMTSFADAPMVNQSGDYALNVSWRPATFRGSGTPLSAPVAYRIEHRLVRGGRVMNETGANATTFVTVHSQYANAAPPDKVFWLAKDQWGAPATHAFRVVAIVSSGALAQTSPWSSPIETFKGARVPQIEDLLQMGTVLNTEIAFRAVNVNWTGTPVVSVYVEWVKEEECGITDFSGAHAAETTAVVVPDSSTGRILIPKRVTPETTFHVRVAAEAAIAKNAGNNDEWNVERSDSFSKTHKYTTDVEPAERLVDSHRGDDLSLGCKNGSSPCASISTALSYAFIKYRLSITPGHYTVDKPLTFQQAGIELNSTEALDIVGQDWSNAANISCNPTTTCVRIDIYNPGGVPVKDIRLSPKKISELRFTRGVATNGSTAAAVSGGALYINNLDTASIIISRCVFEGFVAITTGGAVSIVNVGARIRFSGSLFAGNTARGGSNGDSGHGSGGAVYIDSAPDVGFSNCTFEDNIASGPGGAIAVVSSTPSSVLVEGVSFRRNSAGTRGGALNIGRSSTVEVKKSTFLEDAATDGGGALSMTAAKVSVYGSHISKVSSPQNAAVQCLSSSLEVHASSVVGTTGRGLMSTACAIQLENTIVKGNGQKLPKNGAILPFKLDGAGFFLTAESEIVASNSTFEANVAGGDGGAFACFDCKFFSLHGRTKFLNNMAGRGGAVVIKDLREPKTNRESFVGDGVVFAGNRATEGGGGAIYRSGIYTANFSGVVYENNSGLYGNNRATEAVKAIAFRGDSRPPLSIFNNEPISKPSISVRVLDFLGNIVRDRANPVVIAVETLKADAPILSSSPTSIAVDAETGTANFSEIILAGAPGPSQIKFSAPSLPGIVTVINVSIQRCRHGRYLLKLNPTGFKCEDCAAGKKGDGETCQDCPAGRTQAQSGQSVCTTCPRGTFARNQDETCIACPLGFHQPNLAQLKCLACKPGFFAPQRSSNCSQCELGRVQRPKDQTRCFVCLPGTFSLEPGSDEDGNNFVDGPDTASCLPCPAGAFCSDGLLSAMNGWWRPAPKMNSSFYKCKSPRACKGTKNPALSSPVLSSTSYNESCAEGYGGRLCQRCEVGWSRSGNNDCAKCLATGTGAKLIAASGALVVCLVFAAFIHQNMKVSLKDPTNTSITMKIAASHMQVMAIAAGLPFQWPQSVRTMFRAFDAASSVSEDVINLECVYSDEGDQTSDMSVVYSTTILILLGPFIFLMLASIFWSIIHLVHLRLYRLEQAIIARGSFRWTASFRRKKAKASGERQEEEEDEEEEEEEEEEKGGAQRANVTSGQGQGQLQRNPTFLPEGWARHVAEGGMPYYEQPGGVTQWEKPPGQPEALDLSINMREMSGDSDTTGTTHATKPNDDGGGGGIDVDEGRGDRKKRPTWSRTRQKIIVSVIVVMVLVHPTLTRRSVQLLTCEPLMEGGASERQWSTDKMQLYLVRDLEIVCWEGAHLVWAWTVGLPFLILYAAGIPLASLFVMCRRKHKLHSDPGTVSRFGFLYLGYSKSTWYWEAIVMVRKVGMVMVDVVLAPSGVAVQALVALLMLVLMIQATTRWSPFDSPHIGALEMFSLSTSSLTLWLGCFFWASENADLDMVISVLIVMINVIFIIYLTFVLVGDAFRDYRIVQKVKSMKKKVKSRTSNISQRMSLFSQQSRAKRNNDETAGAEKSYVNPLKQSSGAATDDDGAGDVEMPRCRGNK